VLEKKDFLKQQIDAASRYARLEQLGIGPQCGFSSGAGGGQPITQDDTRRKLELIMEVSQEIWSNT
jgi:5-methyltetrahydropteroyltriglutamate--homocysteine methyltransferase